MLRFLGFILFAMIAVGFADYTTQAKRADEAIGSYPVSTYLTTIKTRIDETSAARDKAKRQGELAKAHLPEAPEGWQRRAWVRDIEGEHRAMLARMNADERALAEQVSDGFIGKLDRKAAIRAAEKESTDQIWEYARGDEYVRINAKFDRPQSDEGLSGAASSLVAASINLTDYEFIPYAVIGGVPFFRSPDMSGDEMAPLKLTAYMGDAITLRVHARAEEEAIRLILGLIDYDNLNAMLDKPLEGVGSAAPALTSEQELTVLQAALATRLGAVFNPAQTAEIDMIRKADDVTALLLSERKQEREAGERVASANALMDEKETRVSVGSQVKPAQEQLVSTRLPDDKIAQLEELGGARSQDVQEMLSRSVRKFETDNNLAKDSCVFSFDEYRVECLPGESSSAAKPVEKAVKQKSTGKVNDADPEPSRLKLSGGRDCLPGASGSLCKK